MPTPFDPQLLLGQRFGLAYLLRLTNEAIQSAMLGTVGFVVLAMFLRRRWAAMLVAIALFTPVAVNGMFTAGTPLLDLLLGALIVVIFFLVVVEVRVARGDRGVDDALPPGAGADHHESRHVVGADWTGHAWFAHRRNRCGGVVRTGERSGGEGRHVNAECNHAERLCLLPSAFNAFYL